MPSAPRKALGGSLPRVRVWTARRSLEGTRFLPDPDAVFWLEIELVARLHAESVVPGIDIAQRPVDPETRRRMAVDGGLLPGCIGAILGAPHLCPAEEYALIAGIAVENRGGRAMQRGSIAVECEENAAEVGDVLAHGLGALHVDAGRDRIGVVLGAVFRSLCLEFGGVDRLPPLGEHAVAIGLAPLVVEAVGQLVTDDAADPAVIDRHVGV